MANTINRNFKGLKHFFFFGVRMNSQYHENVISVWFQLKIQHITSFCLCSFFFSDAAVVSDCAVVHSKDSAGASPESLWWAGEIYAASCVAFWQEAIAAKFAFAHASPSVQNFPHKEMGGFKKNVSLHQSLPNLPSAREIMAVVCDNGRINRQEWGLEGLKGTQKNPCRNVCIFSRAVTPFRDRSSRLFVRWTARRLLSFEMSLPSSQMQSYVESVTRNRGVILLADAISRMAHIWNQMLGMGFPQSTLRAPDRPLCRQPDSCVLRALCQLLCTQCTVTLDAAGSPATTWSEARRAIMQMHRVICMDKGQIWRLLSSQFTMN